MCNKRSYRKGGSKKGQTKVFFCSDNNIPGAHTHKKIVCLKLHSAATQEVAMIGNETDAINHFED